jgi:hypothetical protein
MSKLPLIIIGLLVIACLVMVTIAFANPTENSRQETLANYNHRGEFTYTAYSAAPPTANLPSNALFTKILKSINMTFAYTSPNPEPVDIQVFLADTNTGWQKQIPIILSGGPVYSFQLDIAGLLALGNTINTELGGRGGTYKISLVATVGRPADNLVLTLEGDLNASSLVWHEDGFSKVQKGFPGKDVLREAAFGYIAELTNNSLFGPITVERTAAVPVMIKLDIGFNYQIISGVQVTSVVEDVLLDLTVSETGGWSKTYSLVPKVKKTGAFSLTVPLDIWELLALADANDIAAGSRTTVDRQISLSAQVHTLADTVVGVIDEDFSQQLTGKIGKTLSWDSTDKGGTNLLISTKAGKLTKTVREPDLSIQRLRLFSLVLCVGIFFCIVFLFWRHKPQPALERELNLKRNLKKYSELISEVNEFPPVVGTLVTATSLTSLVKISNNALKPILFKNEGDKYCFRVIDSAFTYEFVS